MAKQLRADMRGTTGELDARRCAAAQGINRQPDWEPPASRVDLKRSGWAMGNRMNRERESRLRETKTGIMCGMRWSVWWVHIGRVSHARPGGRVACDPPTEAKRFPFSESTRKLFIQRDIEFIQIVFRIISGGTPRRTHIQENYEELAKTCAPTFCPRCTCRSKI
jgi:hypothetical protein